MATAPPTLGRRARRLGRRALWTVFGPDSKFERRLIARRYPSKITYEQRDGYRIATGKNVLVVEPDREEGEPLGIFMFGGCDLPSLFALGPQLGAAARRRIVVYHARQPVISMSRADLQLQTLRPLPPATTRETIDRMELLPSYFKPVLFEPEFDTRIRALGTFAKSVVVLTGAANVIRPVYRHKEDGFLVDPGGRWLNRVDDRMAADDMAWFKTNFERVGRMSVDQFRQDFATLVSEIHARAGAEVLVLNALTVEPGSREHNYQLRKSPEVMRRLEFHLAMAELAPQAGFHIVDVDTVLKRTGISGQYDFAHFPPSANEPIAAEAARVLRDAGIA